METTGHGVVNLPEQLIALSKQAMIVVGVLTSPRFDEMVIEKKDMVTGAGNDLLAGIALDPKVVTNLEEILVALQG